jgi:xylulose-5-phosphate/fructose-6-phosphate phosphoketolase
MAVLNRMDRFRLALDVVLRVPRLAAVADEASQRFSETMQRHKLYVSEHGEDLPEVRNWKWTLS